MSQQESNCPVNSVRAKLTFFYNDDSKNGMCSKCHPCKLGIFDAVKILEAVQADQGEEKHAELLRRIAAEVKDGGMCKKGKDHADILAAFLKDHLADLEKHIKGVCGRRECKLLVRYEIDPDKCTMCDECRKVCKDYAIEGQKALSYRSGYTPYRIRQRRCTHCGECIKVCPEGAVLIVEREREPAEKEPVRTLVCSCDVSGKPTGKAPACTLHATSDEAVPAGK